MKTDIVLSTLGHTWILDLDGTLLKHNGYIIDGEDYLLAGAKEFLASIPDGDMIVIVTSRDSGQRESTERFLSSMGIRYDAIIFNAPYGERIVINDAKPSGLAMAHSINLKRDAGLLDLRIILDPKK